MSKIIIITLLALFQTTLFADNYQTLDNANQAEPDTTINTPEVGSQYNAEGMQTRDGQYKSSYSTETVENHGRTRDTSSNPYVTNGSIIPVVPLIIITDE